MTAPPGVTWRVDRIVKISDGDSVRLLRSRVIGETGDLEFTARDTDPRGVAIRLVTLDTPERGEDGHAAARRDLEDWLTAHPHLSVICYGGGGFDRYLGDIHVTGDAGQSVSQWMIIEKNWAPYVR